MPEATDKVAVTDLNAELGKLLGATPTREWRVRMPDGEMRYANDKAFAKYWATLLGAEAVLMDLYPPYDCDRDLMAGVEEELERRGLTKRYMNALCRHAGLMDQGIWLDVGNIYEDQSILFALAHAPPDLRARAARDVLKTGEKEAK
jgi:hypothetical protein